MIRSMTAFARSEHVADWGSLQWELRTVNNRYFDLGLRLPEELRSIEAGVREKIRSRVNRGKVDAVVRLGLNAAGGTQFDVDSAQARRLIEAARAVEKLLGNTASAPISPLDVLRWPGVMSAPAVDVDAISSAASGSLDTALDELIATRDREGEKLAEFILARCEQADSFIAQLRERLPKVVDGVRERLRTRLGELADSIDPQRIEQEMVMFAQRMDSAEELDRLEAHVIEVRRVLQASGPNGRRLDFLTQELNRESNTIASKSSDAEVTRHAVALKVLVEQIREQVQNIE